MLVKISLGICGPDEIFKEKNEVLNGKLLVVVNEPSSDRDDHNKTLKHLITSDFINIDNKYLNAYVNSIHSCRKIMRYDYALFLTEKALSLNPEEKFLLGRQLKVLLWVIAFCFYAHVFFCSVLLVTLCIRWCWCQFRSFSSKKS